MTMTEAATTKPATNALSDLVDTARTRAERARRVGAEALALDLDGIAATLDRARTRLVEDGTEYLDAAWAFVDAGRRALADRQKLAEYLDAIARAAR